MPQIKLLVAHTHAGAVYPAGAVIDVDDYTAGWLTARKIGTQPAAAAPDTAPKPKPRKPKE